MAPRTAEKAPFRILGAALDEVRAFVQALGEPPYRAEQILSWAYGKRVRDFAAMANLPKALRERLARVRLAPTGQGDVELAAFGASADQPMAALPLRRALASTAPLVEGGLAIPQGPLAALNDEDPAVSWCPGRLLQAPGAAPGTAGAFVLSGHLPECHGEAMPWVLGTPWVTLLAMLVFTAEAWAAERRGGVQIELPLAAVQTFGAPPRVDVVVTLPDGREVLCGSLGELCLRTVDALGMAVVPPPNVSQLDAALAPVVTALLRVGVWIWQPDARPRYAISDAFSRACYGQAGTPLRVHGDHLFEALRSTAMAWARSRSDGVEASP